MLSITSLKEKVSRAIGVSTTELSKLSWDEFDGILSPTWDFRRRRGGLVTGACTPLSSKDIQYTRTKVEKILNSF